MFDVKRLFRENSPVKTCEHETSYFFITEYLTHKNLKSCGIYTSASDLPEILLYSFDIIETEINRIKNDELRRKAAKRGKSR